MSITKAPKNYGSTFKRGQQLIITSGRFAGFKGKVVGFFQSQENETKRILSGVVLSDGINERQSFDYRCIPSTIAITAILKTPYNHGYDAYINTNSGKRYYVNWATEPTVEEVVNAWNTDRKWFIHIN